MGSSKIVLLKNINAENANLPADLSAETKCKRKCFGTQAGNSQSSQSVIEFLEPLSYKLLAGMLIVMLFIGGCSSSQPFIPDNEKINVAALAEEIPKEKKMLLSTYEATLNPVDFDKEVEVVQKAHIEEKEQQPPLEIPKDSLIVREEPVQGFRIQVFSSSNVDEAVLMKNIVLEKFVSDSVYLVYDPPMYKIRVGDFVHRYEANQRLPGFVEKGYRDAWIVPDRVIQRKLVRVQLQK